MVKGLTSGWGSERGMQMPEMDEGWGGGVGGGGAEGGGGRGFSSGLGLARNAECRGLKWVAERFHFRIPGLGGLGTRNAEA